MENTSTDSGVERWLEHYAPKTNPKEYYGVVNAPNLAEWMGFDKKFFKTHPDSPLHKIKRHFENAVREEANDLD